METNLVPGQFDKLTESEMGRIARLLVEHCRSSSAGAVWLMEGDLGAGKTTFVSTAAQALGIHETVNSPTFNLHNYYQGESGDLNHFDLYRLGGAAMQELEFAEIWETPTETFTIHAIEWWNKLSVIHSRLKFYKVKIETVDEEHRKVTIISLDGNEVYS
ncbi:MAG: tRNA (adenosine(37)-N6)-threonylcarbamoyltransferase complex ATPase subunit type 1 TsaE [Leptospiraceae bacterium]